MALSQSEFDEELRGFAGALASLKVSISVLDSELERRDIPSCFTSFGIVFGQLDRLANFLDKYDSFFPILDAKFGLDTVPQVKLVKSALGSLRTSLDQLKKFVSERKFKPADNEMKSLSKLAAGLIEGASSLFSVPAKIDYPRLDQKDWMMIGIPGVHYKSRVFLSYKWRDSNPTKDENESLMGNFVKPLLELLGIVPVTFRDNSLPQDPIDDKAIQLISNCNGVVAFYTKGDPISNVEHEIAQNQNLIAICNEEGSRGPSMRRARLQIDFSRDDMTVVMLRLIKALKQDGLFRLKV
jgi:hypothetical protein